MFTEISTNEIKVNKIRREFRRMEKRNCEFNPNQRISLKTNFHQT